MTIKMPHIVKPGDDKRAADFIAGAALRAIPTTEPAAAQDNEAGKAVVNMRFDAQLLARVDAAAAAGDQPHGMAAPCGRRAPGGPAMRKRDAGAARVGVAYR